MSEYLDWDGDGSEWPNRSASLFVQVGHLRWHIQRCGSGPVMLLVHGTGASTHSWRDMLPLLAKSFDVVAVDLPGHGFTSGEKNTDLSLPGVSAALGRLLKDIRVAPQYVVGHSAGAAILVHMCLAKSITPMKLISVNGALLPFRGVAGKLFPTLAKVLYLNPIVPRLLAWRADDERRIRRLIEGMGSKIDDAGIRLYTRLFQNTHHMKSTIKMMAYWDLSRLEARLADLKTPMLLITASQDLAVPAETSFKVSEVVPSARVELIRNGGHLVHEEYPERVCEIILKATRYAPNAS